MIIARYVPCLKPVETGGSLTDQPPPRLTKHQPTTFVAHLRPPTWDANQLRMLLLPHKPPPILPTPRFKSPPCDLS